MAVMGKAKVVAGKGKAVSAPARKVAAVKVAAKVAGPARAVSKPGMLAGPGFPVGASAAKRGVVPVHLGSGASAAAGKSGGPLETSFDVHAKAGKAASGAAGQTHSTQVTPR